MKVSVWVYQHQTEAFFIEKNNNFKNCDPYFTQKIPGMNTALLPILLLLALRQGMHFINEWLIHWNDRKREEIPLQSNLRVMVRLPDVYVYVTVVVCAVLENFVCKSRTSVTVADGVTSPVPHTYLVSTPHTLRFESPKWCNLSFHY